MLTADYVVGLVDGEGSFAVHFNDSQRRRAKVEPRFCLKLKADDRCLLDELREFFGCGKVYIQRDRRPNHSLCFRFEVSNRQELFEKVIPFFEQHPLRFPSKRRDFGLFRQIMALLAQEAHLTIEGLEEMRQLADQMHRGSLDALDTLVQWERG
jgi:LAGLIDADG endonuclease